MTGRTTKEGKRVLVVSMFPMSTPTLLSRLLPLARRLVDRGYRFTFLVSDPAGVDPRHPAIKVTPFRSMPDLVQQILQASSGQYDIVHAHKPFSVTGFASYASCKIKGNIAFVLEADDLEQAAHQVRTRQAQEIFFEKFLMRAAQHVTTNSWNLLAYWKQATYIPVSAELDVFDGSRISEAERGRVRDRYGIQGKMMLWVARLAGDIDQEYIFQIFHEIAAKQADLSLLVVGDGEHRPAMQARVKELGLADHVLFAGRIPFSDLPQYYAAADLSFLPLRNQPFDRCKAPTKLPEAMAMELPIVSTDIGEPKHVIEEANCGILIPFEDAASGAAKILDLAADEQRYMLLGKNGRQYLERYRNYDLLAEELRGVYERAVG